MFFSDSVPKKLSRVSAAGHAHAEMGCPWPLEACTVCCGPETPLLPWQRDSAPAVCPVPWARVVMQVASPVLLFSFSTHMQDLQEVTQDLHYENFWSERLKEAAEKWKMRTGIKTRSCWKRLVSSAACRR